MYNVCIYSYIWIDRVAAGRLVSTTYYLGTYMTCWVAKIPELIACEGATFLYAIDYNRGVEQIELDERGIPKPVFFLFSRL